MLKTQPSPRGVDTNSWIRQVAVEAADEWYADQRYSREHYYLSALDALHLQHERDHHGEECEINAADLAEYPQLAAFVDAFGDAFTARVEHNGSPRFTSVYV